jgi:hypothetical protein
MPQTMNITRPEQREQALGLYTAAGRFADAVVGSIEQRAEQLRSVAAKVRAMSPEGGKILRAILAEDQEEFEGLALRVSPTLQALIDFGTTDLAAMKAELDALADHPVVREVLPALIVTEDEPNGER